MQARPAAPNGFTQQGVLTDSDGNLLDGTFRLPSNDTNNPLPVELATFTARRDGSDAVLRWRTASETNNAGFAVEHQPPEASRYTEQGFVVGAGTTNEPQVYRFRIPKLIPGTHRFRLRQVDTDGGTTRTDFVRVRIEATHNLTILVDGPNPVRTSTPIAFTVKKPGRAVVALYNVLGQRVQTLYDAQTTPGRRHTLHLDPRTLPSGTYYVRLSAASGSQTEQIVVMR